jgi:predicted Ser/Thr protein kinase
LVREFIDGPQIGDWMAGATKRQIKLMLQRIIEQCRALDELGITKQEMTHPHKHILVQTGKPVFIDFDRARFTPKPKNVTQVCQWITGSQLREELEAKGIRLPRDAILAHAKGYKKAYSAVPLRHILELIQNA